MRIGRRQFCAGTLATTLAAALPVRGATPAVLATAAMRDDLALLRAIYERLHPGLTRYQTAAQFAARVERARGWAGRERSPGEFYLALARLTAAVRCGHTHANPFNQSDAVQKGLLGQADRLPFFTAWLDGRLYITDPLASGLPRGARIARIDGIRPERMLAEMLPLTRADGGNDGKRVAQLELRGTDRFAAFDIFRSLRYRPSTERAAIELVEPSGRRATGAVAPVAEGARGGGRPGEADRHGWRFGIDGDGMGLLTMPNWGLYDSKWDWRGFIGDAVDRLVSDKARGLVVDLRENEGGLDCGDALLARVIAAPVEDGSMRRLVRFRETPPEWRSYLDTWDRSFHTLGVDATHAEDRPGFLELPGGLSRKIDPTGTRFTGPMAVLVGPTCSSATYGFAQLVKQQRIATLVGEETGGNRRGINGGRYFFVRLPATGFEVDLPLVGYYPREPQPDAGVVPDVIARRTAADLASGFDRALAAARRAVLA